MINVILIDDEDLARNYLVNLVDWEHYGFKLLGAFSDAQQAIKAFQKYRPQLVISDVFMPGKNGLEMVSEIRDIDKTTHILFISAYNSFDYAMQAIHLKTDDYILKDELDPERFLIKLLEIRDVIIKEEQISKYTMGSMIEELFKTDAKEEKYQDLISREDFLKLHKRYAYVIISKCKIPDFIDEIFHQNSEIQYGDDALVQSYRDIASQYNLRIVSDFRISSMNYLLVIESIKPIIREQEIKNTIIEFSGSLSSYFVGKALNVNIHYYYHQNTIKDFSTFYSCNNGSIIEQYLVNSARVLEFRESEQRDNAQPSVNIDDIIIAMKKNDHDRVGIFIDITVRSLKEKDYITFFWYVKSMLIALKQFDGQLMDSVSGRRFSILEKSSEFHLDNPEELIRFISYKSDEVLSISDNDEKKRYSESIVKTLTYLKQHYSDPELNLKNVSQAVNLSTSWLSTKFKEEVGTGINEYICTMRIEKAKEILSDTDDMAYEVSEKVGFTSSQYFSRVFKELVGVTPNKFRGSGND